jgi:hypothetical protein
MSILHVDNITQADTVNERSPVEVARHMTDVRHMGRTCFACAVAVNARRTTRTWMLELTRAMLSCKAKESMFVLTLSGHLIPHRVFVQPCNYELREPDLQQTDTNEHFSLHG